MRSRWVLSSVAIAVAGGIAYASAFPGAFVFDDAYHVAVNEKLDRPLAWFPGGDGYRALPNRSLAMFTFALDRMVAGSDASFHRAVNVAVHVATALLVLAFAAAAFRAPRLRGSALAPASWAVGLTAGLLFVTHPIQTQAVAYVVQRMTSLATLLYVAVAVLYVRWRNARDAGRGGPATWGGYAAALALAVLATRAKEIAFTLPVALLLVEAVLFEGPWRARLLGLAPFALTMVVIPLSTLATAAPAGEAFSDVTSATRVETTMGRGDYLLTELTVVARYLGLLVFPAGQTVDHDVARRTSLADPAVLGSAALLAGVAAAAILLALAASPRRPRPADPATRLAALGIAWFFLGLSVESTFIPIVDPMVEHRVYLPFAGLSLAIATLLALGMRRVAPRRSTEATVGVAAVLAAVLGAVTFVRGAVWRSDEALWRDAVEKSPAKARPHHNLGVALDRQGRHADALVQLQEAVRLAPSFPQARESLGIRLGLSGRVPEGEAHLRRAIELAPSYAAPWYDLGLLRLEAGRCAEAVPYFERAIALRRDYPDAWANLAACWNVEGRSAEAARALGEARDVIRKNALARAQLAIGVARIGDVPGARAELEAVRRLSPAVADRVRPLIP